MRLNHFNILPYSQLIYHSFLTLHPLFFALFLHSSISFFDWLNLAPPTFREKRGGERHSSVPALLPSSSLPYPEMYLCENILLIRLSPLSSPYPSLFLVPSEISPSLFSSLGERKDAQCSPYLTLSLFPPTPLFSFNF